VEALAVGAVLEAAADRVEVEEAVDARGKRESSANSVLKIFARRHKNLRARSHSHATTRAHSHYQNTHFELPYSI
jgi:hypothetical protein